MTMIQQWRQDIITLHYVYPLSFQKLQRLMMECAGKSHLVDCSIQKLSLLLNVPENKARMIQHQFLQFRTLPLTDQMEKERFHIIVYGDEDYPKMLYPLYDPPVILYVLGEPSFLQKNMIAIIGARDATNYSEQIMDVIIPPLVANDLLIVSGMAKGADTLAHQQTIKHGGQTVAVLGSGFWHIYPKENEALFWTLQKSHCIVTEYPPYMPPNKWHFPMRNRIISGLAQALVVTEAKERSGTLITTTLALEQGKDVFVVPGSIFSPTSTGTNQLLKEGAIPIWNGEQIVEEMKLIFM
jgi:DNA processing protein